MPGGQIEWTEPLFNHVFFLTKVYFPILTFQSVYISSRTISTVLCQERVEYLHLTGPGSIPGHTQLAVTRPKGLGCDTPSSEPGYSLTDQLTLTDWEDGDEMLSAEHMTAKLGFTK